MSPLFIFTILVLIVWIAVLVTHLKATDMDPTDKICWTIVLCSLNVLGLILYFIYGPKIRHEDSFDTEEKIKKAANEGRLK